MNNEIWIPGNVSSSKNSKQWTGKFLVHSKTAARYIKNTKGYYMEKKQEFLDIIKDKEKPYKIEFYFVRDSRRKFDYVNAAQLPLDLMQKYGWLEDDNCEWVIPSFAGYEVDKDNAGMIIRVW
ncbi:hypothetical protein H8D85_01855 [bacterium]|nr:hypothetical protein [bacterium]